jgi:hypothetical protein
MYQFKYFIALLATVILLYSCHSTSIHPRSIHPDAQLMDVSWKPADSLRFYFPQSRDGIRGFSYTRSDTFKEKWYSSSLFSLREPVLFDKQIQTDLYRFLWLRSFNRPMVFVLRRTGDRVTLTTKKLDREPEFEETKYVSKGWPGLMDELKGKTIEKVGDSLVIVKADRKAELIYDSTRTLTVGEWQHFEELLQKVRFVTMAATSNDAGMDGSEWILEHLYNDQYQFVNRWSPESGIHDVGVYLITLSGLKERIY